MQPFRRLLWGRRHGLKLRLLPVSLALLMPLALVSPARAQDLFGGDGAASWWIIPEQHGRGARDIWSWEANGDFVSPHLQGPRLGNGSTQARMAQAAIKIGAAALTHKIARDAAARPGAGLAEILAEQIARTVRDAAIESALADLFPRLTDRQARDVQRLISSYLDGLRILDGSAQRAKQRLIDDLRTIDANLADIAVIADFLYITSQRRPR